MDISWNMLPPIKKYWKVKLSSDLLMNMWVVTEYENISQVDEITFLRLVGDASGGRSLAWMERGVVKVK